jgi:hypothetical protein
MFDAPFGGTTRASHAGFDSCALSAVSPWKGWGWGGGTYLPSMVVVAGGDPGAPVVCCPIPAPMERLRPKFDIRYSIFERSLLTTKTYACFTTLPCRVLCYLLAAGFSLRLEQ